MRKMLFIAILVLVTALLSFSKKGSNYTIPKGWPKPVYDFKKHPLNEQQVQLGKRLFYETALSRDNTISCNSCHTQYNAFTHADHSLSHGIEGRIGNRNSPALMNLAWSKHFMWDGAIAHLDKQAQTPISNPLEMDEKMDNVIVKLRQLGEYRQLFFSAYGDSLVTADGLMQALSQFMLTLVSANARYDRVMDGRDTFTQRERNGYALFQQHCAACHKEPLFTSDEFENNGLPVDTTMHDIGRMKISGRTADAMKYKVPTLRNIEVTYPYMHDGRFRNLQMVLFHYSEGVHQSGALSAKLPGKLSLSEQQKGDIIMFLKTLTDETFLKDKRYNYN